MMRLLTAAAGSAPGDFAHAVPGELVYLGIVCARDRYGNGQGCGCGRAFIGLASHRGTTLAQVAEFDMGPLQLVQIVRAALLDAGWPTRAARALASEMVATAAPLDVGSYVRRHLDELRPVPAVEGPES